MFFQRRPFPDAEPVPLNEAVEAALGSLRLAWEADRVALVGLVALQAATATAEVAQLALSGGAVDALVAGRRPAAQARRLLLVGGLSLVVVGGRSASRALEEPLGQAVFHRAEGRILDAVATLELADVEDPALQDRLQQALGAAHREQMLITTTLAFPPAAIGLLGSLATMRASDRALVPLGLLGVVPQWLVDRRTQDPMRRMWMRGGRQGRETGILRHYLTGAAAAHELRVFDATPYLRARHDELSAEAAAVQREVVRTNARWSVLGALAARAADGPAAGRLVLKVTRRQASVADAVTGGLATKRMASGFQRLAGMTASLRRAAALVTEARSFAAPATAGGATGPPPTSHFRRIVVDGVCFTYRGTDTPVLDGVDMEIGQGEVVALVGENGCGKTTLAKILCGLYRPTKGAIRWDDVDATKADPAQVRARIAVVFQDFVRYPSLTAAQNIGIGLPARMDDRPAIEEAARRAGAHGAIDALPEGYDTVLSRQFGGVDLSMGQWQRVALARAFLRDAPLVVLDEPTAALDPRAERDLFETVASLYRSRSAVLISHRLSSVRFADRICVLAGGRITESGAHEELVTAGGAYAELFEMQARAYR
jgi:ATP-binding cassette, subfamily B, bacterial